MFKDLVLANRSYRGYDQDTNINRDQLLSLVELARLAPSGGNKQPLKYYLAYEKDIVSQIQKTTKWAGLLPELSLPYPNSYPTAFIIICQDTNITSSIAACQKDVGIAAQTMLLGAAEMGLGGCMIGSYSAKDVISITNMAKNLQPVLVVALGKPAEKIILTDSQYGDVKYYRDENNIHFVPKRLQSDIVIN